jgi:hypothetical protein
VFWGAVGLVAGSRATSPHSRLSEGHARAGPREALSRVALARPCPARAPVKRPERLQSAISQQSMTASEIYSQTMAKLRLIDRWAAFTDEELGTLVGSLDQAEGRASVDCAPVAVEALSTRSALRSSAGAPPRQRS